MALEKELKFTNVDHDDLRQRLEALGHEQGDRYFESNVVLDDADRSLKQRGVLLRVRTKKDACVLTVKEPVDSDSKLKIYDEHNTNVSDSASMLASLSAIGYQPAFAYEKVREKWKGAGCIICLDLLPFGAFLEIEGEEADVMALADKLELGEEQASTETYHALNRMYQEQNGLERDENFVFSDREREELMQLLRA